LERGLVAALKVGAVAGQSLSVVGLASLIALAPVASLGANRVLVIRASLFLVLTLLVLRVGVRELWALIQRPDALTSCVYLLALFPVVIAVWSTATYPIGGRWIGTSYAAAVEEVVFRVALPRAIGRVVVSPPRRWVRLWLSMGVAQVSFGLSHLTIGGGLAVAISHSKVLLGLLAGGFLLASSRLLMGVPAAVGVHSLANLAIASNPPDLSRPGTAATASLCVAALVHLGWTAKTRAQSSDP
jgi:hypothetical protein